MPAIVIFGYGNPLRGDDAVGFLVARELEIRLTGTGVRVISTHQLNPEHAEILAQSN